MDTRTTTCNPAPGARHLSESKSPTQRCAEHLRRLPLFQEARPRDIDALAPLVRLVHVPRRTTLFKQGDPCDGFHLLVYGRVKLSLKSAHDLEKPLHIAEAGDSFGDITMFLERPYYLLGQTLEDSLLVYVPREAILQLISQDSRFALRMMASLSMRMRGVVDDIESFSLQPPAARLVTYLMRMLPPGAMNDAKIELHVNKNTVAAQLNLTPETLSRYFRALSDQGLVTLQGRTVLVHHVDRLGEYLAHQSKLR